MLLRATVLEKIKSGEISVVFRKWKRAGVKTGGTLHTAMGILSIEAVDLITENQITDGDAKRAGYDSRKEVIKELGQRKGGELYRIRVSYLGVDPRIELREDTVLTPYDFEEINQRLQGLDARSKYGSWSKEVLKLIRSEPEHRAAHYARKLDVEKQWFKENVRKLKNLGLTISLPDGYDISPRGREFLKISEDFKTE